MTVRKRQLWQLSAIGVVVLSVLSFTPLVLNFEGPEPYLFGLPHTLWAGMLIAFLLVLLTIVGARVHPESESEGDPE